MHKICSHSLVLFFFFLWSIPLKSQSFFATNYTTKEGLASDEIYWIIQDQKGIIWIGTDAGLSSFDGTTFTNYATPSTKDQSITCLLEDKNGRIWGHNFANEVFYIQNDSIYLWDKTPSKEALSTLTLNEDQLLIKHLRKAYSYNYINDTIREIDYAFAMNLRADTSLVFGEHLGFRLQTANASLPVECASCFFKETTNKKLPTHRVYKSGVFRKKKRLTLFYYNTLIRKDLRNEKGLIMERSNLPFVFKLKHHQLHPIQLPPQLSSLGKALVINKLKIENDSMVWLASSKGLYQWNIHNNQVTKYLPNTNVSDILIDQEKNLWVTTIGKGIFFVPIPSIHKHQPQNSNNKIFHIEAGNNRSLLLSYEDNTLLYWDLATQQSSVTTVPIYWNIEKIYHLPPQNNFIICTKSGPYLYSSSTNQLKETILSNPLPPKDITFDRYGNSLEALGHGAFIHPPPVHSSGLKIPNSWKSSTLERRLKSFKRLNPNRAPSIILDSLGTRSYCIAYQEQPQYTVWVGYVNQLRYYVQGESFELKNKKKQSVPAKDLATQNDSILWVGTMNDGIYAIQDYKIIKHLGLKDGLPSKQVSKILVHKEYLWASTPKGLARYHFASGKIDLFNEANGFSVWDVTDWAMLGDTLFLLEKGELLSLPYDLEVKPPQPKVWIASTWVNDSIRAIDSTKMLPYFMNNFKIKVQGIAYKSQGAFQYKYRLYPIEKKWNYINSNQSLINYSNLKGGAYSFEVALVTDNGVVSPMASTRFSIDVIFYQKWWFILLCTCLLALFILWLLRYQSKIIDKRNQEKLRKSKLERDLRVSELKVLKAQLNPHFIFNALNSIQEYIMMNEKELAGNYLGMFADLMRIYLDHSREHYISLAEEINALKIYLELEAIRLDNELHFDIQINNHRPIQQIMIPSMLVQPYVENAIKHGLFPKEKDKNLWVIFNLMDDNIIEVIIRDNGIGREAAAQNNRKRVKKHRSFGSAATASRLELLNDGKEKKIRVNIIDLKENGQSLGTEVHVFIPFWDKSADKNT